MKKLLLVGPLVLVAAWFLVSRIGVIDAFFFPGPIETFTELVTLLTTGVILNDILATVVRTAYAFLISAIIGIPLGLGLGSSERLYRSIEFIIDIFRSTPATAIFPLFLLLFGIADNSKIAAAIFGAVLIIIFNTAYGVINSKKTRTIAAKNKGASRWQIFRWITFWESLPQTFVGLRNAISLTLVIIIVTEMFIGTSAGLGQLIIDYQFIYNIKGMYAIILLSGIIGYISNYILIFFEKRFVHWSTK